MSDEQQSSTSISEDLQRLAEESYRNSRTAIVGWRLNETINLMRKHCSVPVIEFLGGVIMDSFNGDYLHNARRAEKGQWFIDIYIDIDKHTITASEFMLQHWENLTNAKQVRRGAVKLGAVWSLPVPYSDICDAMFDDIVCLSRLEFDNLRSPDSHNVDDDTDDPTLSKLHSFIEIADVLL